MVKHDCVTPVLWSSNNGDCCRITHQFLYEIIEEDLSKSAYRLLLFLIARKLDCNNDMYIVRNRLIEFFSNPNCEGRPKRVCSFSEKKIRDAFDDLESADILSVSDSINDFSSDRNKRESTVTKKRYKINNYYSLLERFESDFQEMLLFQLAIPPEDGIHQNKDGQWVTLCNTDFLAEIAYRDLSKKTLKLVIALLTILDSDKPTSKSELPPSIMRKKYNESFNELLKNNLIQKFSPDNDETDKNDDENYTISYSFKIDQSDDIVKSDD